MTFTPEAFPTTFTLLYCPFAECPDEERPFLKPADILKHIQHQHSLHICDAEAVTPILDLYLEHVAARKAAEPELTQVGTDDADRACRLELQHARLQQILDQQHRERQTTHKLPGQCLFCPQVLPDRYALFQHMYREHAFNIGQLDNLVFVETFLTTLKSRLQHHHCLYCENVFPDGGTLRRHMRGKGHFRINAHNHAYDRHYVVNYMLPGRTWEDLVPEDGIAVEEECSGEGVEEEWDELDEEVDMRTMCLLCSEQSPNPDEVIAHMLAAHDYDFIGVLRNLTFYDAVKLVNHVRICFRDGTCPFCGIQNTDEHQCASREILREKYDDAQYLIPFYEEDALLSVLDQYTAGE